MTLATSSNSMQSFCFCTRSFSPNSIGDDDCWPIIWHRASLTSI